MNRHFSVSGFFSKAKHIFSKPVAPVQMLGGVEKSIAYSKNGHMNFVFGGKKYVFSLKGMRDRKVTAIKTGDLVTLIDSANGRILAEIPKRGMVKRIEPKKAK